MSVRPRLPVFRDDIFDVMFDDVVRRGNAPTPPAPDARGLPFRVKLHPPPRVPRSYVTLVRKGVRTCAGKLAHIKEDDCLHRDNDQGECGWCGRTMWAWLAYCSTSCEDAMQAHIHANLQRVGPSPCWGCGDRSMVLSDGVLCGVCSAREDGRKLPRGDGSPW